MSNLPQHKIVNTADLIPYARNSRTHSDEQVAQIAASIREFGFLNPIIVDGDNGIIAGHGRVLAAQKLKIEQLPCIEASHLTEAQRKAYVIADNKLALNAGWDNELLRVELDELKGLGLDVEIIGWGETIPEPTKDVDYSILNDDEDGNYEKQIQEMTSGVKKAIQIEFESADYERAVELVKYWRQHGAYIGGMLIGLLHAEKQKL